MSVSPLVCSSRALPVSNVTRTASSPHQASVNQLQLLAGQAPGQGPQPHQATVKYCSKLGLTVNCCNQHSLGSGCNSSTYMSLRERGTS